MLTHAHKAPSHSSQLRQAFTNTREMQFARSLHNITLQLPIAVCCLSIPEAFQGSVTDAHCEAPGAVHYIQE